MTHHQILVTGALGQIGSELTPALRAKHAIDDVIATDIRAAPADASQAGPFEQLDCAQPEAVLELVQRRNVKVIYHLAAMLSATGEAQPQRAWAVNMDGLMAVLEAARANACKVFVPSSIAAFGPTTERDHTPQVAIQRPTTMYGVTKVAGELLCDYYRLRFGVDVRGLRYPGLISHSAPPGGGTTDYAVEIFHSALKHGEYTCYLASNTRLPMMYMPDAIRATLELMDADGARLAHRNAFNVHAMSFTPDQLADEIRKSLPGFVMRYDVQPRYQTIADAWPRTLDDSSARSEWGWRPSYDLAAMTRDMLDKLSAKMGLRQIEAAS